MADLDGMARRTRWVPAPHPHWLSAMNSEGAVLDLSSVVPLDARSLVQTARGNTGLTDFGTDPWQEPFEILTRALEGESNLTLMGRVMARAHLVMLLEARLRIEDTYRMHPEIEDEQIVAPLIIVGQGRTGTTVMQSLLAADPANGTTRTWEVLFPCPPPKADTYATDPRIARADGVMRQLHRCAPELGSMHEFAGWEPTESVHLHCLAFRSGPWLDTMFGQVPTYTSYMMGQDPALAYEYEKRVLKLLQWRNPRRTWVMKSPITLLHMPSVLEVYPDAGFVWTHRDPIKALASTVNLIGTLQWVRSETPFIGDSLAQFTRSDLSAGMLAQPIQWLQTGVLPAERLCNIRYADFVRDPIEVIATIYRTFGLDLTAGARSAMEKYMRDNPRSGRPSHDYDVGPDSEIRLERAAFKEYQAFFDVPDEC